MDVVVPEGLALAVVVAVEVEDTDEKMVVSGYVVVFGLEVGWASEALRGRPAAAMQRWMFVRIDLGSEVKGMQDLS